MSVTVNLKHQALQVVAGSTTTLTANLELVDDASGTYVATWYANNLGEFDIQHQVGSGAHRRDLGVSVVWLTAGQAKDISIHWNTTNVPTGRHTITLHVNRFSDNKKPPSAKEIQQFLEDGAADSREFSDQGSVDLVPAAADPTRVSMLRAEVAPTSNQALWTLIRESTNALSFKNYSRFMDIVLCGEDPDVDERSRLRIDAARRQRSAVNHRLALPFPEVEPYRQLKVATEVFLMVNCGINSPLRLNEFDPQRDLDVADIEDEARRYNRAVRPGDVERYWNQYLERVSTNREPADTLPYLALIRRKLKDVSVSDPVRDDAAVACLTILMDKLTKPCLLELIWSYWHEEGMLVQTMNAISWRFQNRRGAADRDPLALLEIDPLRPLNNFVWGYIQDEQHRLTVPRRAYEYDHHYGLTIIGKAVPRVRGADSRARFLEAFHHLLYICSGFYKEDDDTTVVADGFPVLNALKEVHLLLTQGAHNQYGDLPWMARQEMLMQQWMLARPEMREFLPSRIMVDYPEEWMDRVETMKTLQGWGDASILHFRDLGIFGEQILLGIRFEAWPSVIESQEAANWARYWRPEIQGYIHAYRAVTGTNLTERADPTPPSLLLQRRLSAAPRSVAAQRMIAVQGLRR